MLVLWLNILTGWILCSNSVGNYHVHNTQYYAVNHGFVNRLDTTTVSNNYLPYTHRIADQGLSYESIPTHICFKKIDIRNNGQFQVRNFYKLSKNITYILPVNPLVTYHWICRIQV
jgi:hypothetical protein